MSSPHFERLRAQLAARPPRQVDEHGVPEAAVAVVLAPDPRGMLELLLIRRAQREGDPWSGHMALPGGRRDSDDLDLLATARRETLEELAIELDPRSLLGALDDLRPISTPRRMTVRPFVFGLAERPHASPSPEVDEFVWTALDEFARSASTTEVFHLGALRTLPCYRVGERVVWGMTQRILEPLLTLAR